MLLQKALEIVKRPTSCVSAKTRALFHLRCADTEEAALIIEKCITNSSVLIDHEVAYILGQMKQPASIPFLLRLAEDEGVNSIVRHEAIEALGNFEDINLIERIEPFMESTISIVRESAVLAIKKLQEEGKKETVSKYYSRDPAYAYEGSFEKAVEMFKNGEIVEKYRALFYLRNLNTKEAVDALAEGFKDSSDLLRHEIAYVFGQMTNPASVDALISVAEDEDEADIVRHEAAEALGNIGGEKAEECLQRLLDSDIQILNESARVGLGIYNYDSNEYIEIDDLAEK